MRKVVPAYIETLKTYFEKEKTKDPQFSLRKFAKVIGISPGLLSDIIKNKKSLPEKYLQKVIELMTLSQEQEKAFRESYYESLISLHRLALKKEQSSNERVLDNNYDNRIISEWEYYAIFTLFDIEESFTNEWAAQHLGINEELVQSVLGEFESRGIVVKDNEVYRRKYDRLTTTMNVPSEAIRESHKKTLELAKDKIDEIPMDSRYFSSTTVAIDKSKLTEVRAIYREFREKLTTLLEEGEQSDVYRFAFTLFPLSNTKKELQ